MRKGSYSLVFVDRKIHKRVIGPIRELHEIDAQVMETHSGSIEDLCNFICTNSTIPIRPDDVYILYRDGETEERLEVCLQQDELVAELLKGVFYIQPYGWRVKEDNGVVSRLCILYLDYWKKDGKFKLLLAPYLDSRLKDLTRRYLEAGGYSPDTLYTSLYDYRIARNLAIGIRKYKENSLPPLPDSPNYDQLIELELDELEDDLMDEPHILRLVRYAVAGDDGTSDEVRLAVLIDNLTQLGRESLDKIITLIEKRNDQRGNLNSQLSQFNTSSGLELSRLRPIR